MAEPVDKQEQDVDRLFVLDESDILSKIINSVADPIFVKDEDHRWILMNDAFCAFLGHSREELTGQSDYTFFPKEQADVFWEKDNAVFTSMQQLTNVEHLTDNDGSIHTISTKKVPFELPGGRKVLVGIIQDITDFVRTKEELEAARDQARAASRAKSDFLARMSHDIRTPMNGIIGMIELLIDSSLDKKQQELAGTIRDSARSLLNLVNDLLDFSRIEAGKLDLNESTFCLQEEMSKLESLFKPRIAEKSQKFYLKIDPHLPEKLRGDADKLHQVMMNLISNSIKFTPDAGSIQVIVKGSNCKDDKCSVEFSVKDSGCGIAEEQIRELFDPFFQAGEPYISRQSGHGLGLAICKNLVGLLGGEISVESQVGKGTTMSFLAEFEKPKGEDPSNKSKAAAGVYELPPLTIDGRQVKVLIVEDNAINQKLIRKLFQKMECVVELASNGKEAVELAQQDQYDLILMDISMPVMDGITATKEIRKTQSPEDLPIIALTAHAIHGDRERFEEAGVSGYVSKPIDREKLLSEIRRLLSI